MLMCSVCTADLEAGEGGSGQGGRGSGDGQPNHAGQGQGQRGAAKGGSHMPPVVGGYIVGDLLGKGGFGEVSQPTQITEQGHETYGRHLGYVQRGRVGQEELKFLRIFEPASGTPCSA